MCDEEKVKDLIEDLVHDIFDCFMPNGYTASMKESVIRMIRERDLK